MAFSLAQAWTNAVSVGAATSPIVLASIPTTGNLLVCTVTLDLDVAQTASCADNIGDAGVWATAAGPGNNSINGERLYIFWKVVGTPSGGQKTITVTSTGVQTKMTICAAEYAPGTVGTISIDGTSVQSNGSGTNPVAGTIVTTAAGLVVGWVGDNNATPAAGSGFTNQTTPANSQFNAVEDQITVSAGSYSVAWVEATNTTWGALGAAFKVTASGGGGTSARSKRLSVNFGPSLGVN